VLGSTYWSLVSATLNAGPFCTSTCPELTYGAIDYICVGVENNEVFCYGSTAACMFGTYQCATDVDCVAYNNSPKRSAGMCDNRAFAGGTDWPWSGCNGARLRDTAPPTQTPTTIKPTAAPTVDPSADPTATPTVDPTIDPTASPSASPTATPTAGPYFRAVAEPIYRQDSLLPQLRQDT
jgi:hypothetical protein